MSNIVFYHNPRCSTSKKALDLLRQNHIDPTIIEYLKTPPSREELKRLLKMLNMPPRDLLRKKESLYEELNLHHKPYTDEQIIDAIVENPVLMERPILVVNNKAVVGRPAEKVLEIV